MNGAMELLRAAQEGDRDACEQAVLENNGLIWSVVRRYYGRGVEPDDLYQLGCLGFLKAIRGFDFSYGTCFSTYAVPKIAGEIRRFLRDDGTIKVGRSIREQALTLYALRERLRQLAEREGNDARRRLPRWIWPRKRRIPCSGRRQMALHWKGCWARRPRRRDLWRASPCGRRWINCRKRSA